MHEETKLNCGGKRFKSDSHSPGSRPLISVITPVFNASRSLESSIQSVVGQNCTDLEYIILDGGSTDRTPEILRRYESSIDYWISEPDRGIYDAMNKGIQLARGRWLLFLGADDTLCETFCEAPPLLRDEQTIYYGNVFMTGAKRLYDGPFGAWKLACRNICQQAIFYPRELFEVRQFNLRYRLLADWELNLRTYCDPQFNFHFIPVTITNYNDQSGRSSVETDGEFVRDHGRILRECLPARCFVWHTVRKTLRPVLNAARGRK